jgi:hypothetical protein
MIDHLSRFPYPVIALPKTYANVLFNQGIQQLNISIVLLWASLIAVAAPGKSKYFAGLALTYPMFANQIGNDFLSLARR